MQYSKEPSFDLGALLDDEPESNSATLPDCAGINLLLSSPPKATVSGGDVEILSRFKPPTSEDIMQQLSAKTFAENMQRKVQWAVLLFECWRQNCLKMPTCCHEIMFCNIQSPSTVNKNHLAKVLTYFVTEIGRKDGGKYEGRALYDIVICIQFHFKRAGIFWKLIDDSEVMNLKWTLDNLMKACCSAKLGTTSKASPISFDEENRMWLSGGRYP